MKYDSLHSYLDVHLSPEATDDDIARAKAAYWKQYRTEHRKQRRKKAKPLTITLSRSVWNKLSSQAHKADINVYDFIKRKLEQDGTVHLNVTIKKTLFECIELLGGESEEVTLRLESLINTL